MAPSFAGMPRTRHGLTRLATDFAVVGVLLVAIVALGLRQYSGTTPLVSTNSMAISAACHVPPPDREAGYLMPVAWGVVGIKDGIGKCSLTTAPRATDAQDGNGLRRPIEGMRYR